MNQLGFCPYNNFVWELKTVVLIPTHIIQRLEQSWRFSTAKDLDTYKIVAETNLGVIEIPTERIYRIVEENRIHIFTHHPPILMTQSIKIDRLLLTNSKYNVITGMRITREHLDIKAGSIYRINHYLEVQ